MNIAVSQLHAEQAKQWLDDGVEKPEKRRNDGGVESVEQTFQFGCRQAKK